MGYAGIGGSYVTVKEATERDQVLKDHNSKAYCVSRNRYHFSCVAFDSLARPISASQPLMRHYCSAAEVNPAGRLAIL